MQRCCVLVMLIVIASSIGACSKSRTGSQLATTGATVTGAAPSTNVAAMTVAKRETAIVTDAQVTAAMRKAADYLLAAQRNDNWESEDPADKGIGDRTPVVLQALLETSNSLMREPEYRAKLHYRSKLILPALDKLMHNPPKSAHVACLQMTALSLVPRVGGDSDQKKTAVRLCVKEIVAGAPAVDVVDATMGFQAAEDFGQEIAQVFWEQMDKALRESQRADGLWAAAGGLDDADRTAACLAALLTTRQVLDAKLRLVPKPDQNVDAAMSWLDRTYAPDADIEYLLATQRVAQLTGRRFFGGVNAYKAAAAAILARQNPDGSWTGKRPVAVETAKNLSFLAKGHVPLFLNKLQYDGTWNARPQDAIFLTRWIGRRLCEVPLQSQTITLDAPLEELLNPPLLLITGSKDPRFTKDQLAKLRAFVLAGGTIFSSADGNSAEFTEAMRQYALNVTHRNLRRLPPTHDLFDKQLWWEVKTPVQLLGASNDVRELWIHSPTDVSADWQKRSFTSPAFSIGQSLYFYVTGMVGRYPQAGSFEVAPQAVPPTRTMTLARINCGTNPDPEPGAWPRMAQLARRDFSMDLKLQNVRFVDLAKGGGKQFPLAHLTNTHIVDLTDGEFKDLKQYMNNGGVLFLEAAGGNAEVAASLKNLVANLYPNRPLEPIPADTLLYSGVLPGSVRIDDESTTFRKYGSIKLQRRVKLPELSAITIDGKIRVIFSPWDISSGFLGTNTWGIVGYSPENSQALARNILLYVHAQR